MWNFPLCSERALQRDWIHPACFPIDHRSEPLCYPGVFPDFEAASACLIIVTGHLKFHSKFIFKLGCVRGIQRLAMLVGDASSGACSPLQLLSTNEGKNGVLWSWSSPACIKLQLPLTGLLCVYGRIDLYQC